MLGEVPTSVIDPPSSEAKESGIRNSDGERLLRRATCTAAGMKIASAPIFLTKAESSTTQPTSTPTWRSRDPTAGRSQRTNDLDRARLADRGRDDQRRGDQRQHRVGKAGERLVRRDDARRDRGHQRQQRDDVEAQPLPQEQGDHHDENDDRQDLRAAHVLLRPPALAGPRGTPRMVAAITGPSL